MSSAGVFAFAGASVLLLALQHVRRKLQSINVAAQVKELWLFPIKGCRGFQVDSAPLTRRGLKHDRLLMVVNADNKFISQRCHPKMVLMTTSISTTTSATSSSGRAQLRINGPGMSELVIDLPNDYDSLEEEEHLMGAGGQHKHLAVTVWGSECQAYEISKSASEWMSNFLSRSVEKVESLRLVRISAQCVRKCNDTTHGQTGFADGYPFLLASTSSIDELKRRLPPSAAASINMENFRPNIVIEGCSRPFEEDTWKEISFLPSQSSSSHSPIQMSVVSHCSRCRVPSLNTETAVFAADSEPSQTMKAFRTGQHLGLATQKEQKELYFGVNLDHAGANTGDLNVGQTLVAITS